MHDFVTNRVVFYPINDLASGFNLLKGEDILKNEIELKDLDINDILELYNLKQYIDNGVFLKQWSSDEIATYKNKIKEFNVIIGKFTSKINNDNIEEIYEYTFNNYIKSFWEIVCNFKIFKRISESTFNNILINEHQLIYEILTHKLLVNHYNNVIKDFLLDYSNSAELILDYYEVKNTIKDREIFLPSNFTIENIETIINNYLDSDVANLNYVDLLYKVNYLNGYKINDKIRLKAKHKYKILKEELLNGKLRNSTEIIINFKENTHEKKEYIKEDNTIKFTYSLDYLKANFNSEKLFHNLIVLFEFIDEQYRITLVSKNNYLSELENIIGVHSKNYYKKGYVFEKLEIISFLQMKSYSIQLNKLGLSLEELFHNIFTSYLQEKYGFSHAYFIIPTAQTYLEKVRVLAPEFESILKQYKLFVEEKHIDYELLQISSKPLSIKDIPSLNTKKYIYLNSAPTIKYLLKLLFSSQTTLTFVEPNKNLEYNTFFDLLINQDIYYNNYIEFQKLEIDYLIERQFITIDNNGFIKIINIERLIILKDLYENEVASFHCYSEVYQKEVLLLESENIIYFESTLFTKLEQSYFNYYLNNSEFSNGLALRNHYLHGTQALPKEIEQHELAYFNYWKLLFLALLKIESDLVIYKMVQSKI